MVLSAFSAENFPAERWRDLLQTLSSQGHAAFFFPIFQNLARTTAEHIALARMVMGWGAGEDQLPSLLVRERNSHGLGKRWCQSVWPQTFRPKSGWYEEASNSKTFRDGWTQAIRSGADAVDLVTWNDYSEATEIRPSTGAQFAFHDLAAYYISWFKMGTPPPIVRDVIYYFHRVQPAGAPGFGNKQSKPFVLKGSVATDNEVEALAFLTSPGRVSIQTSRGTVHVDAPAGITSVRAPLAPGAPAFRLDRGGKNVLSFSSAFSVQTSAPYEDLLYRGGSSSRAPLAPA